MNKEQKLRVGERIGEKVFSISIIVCVISGLFGLGCAMGRDIINK